MVPCRSYHTFIAIVSWTNYYLFSLPSLAQSRVRTKQFKFGDRRHPGPDLHPYFCKVPFLIPTFSGTNFKVDICHQNTSFPKGPPRMTHLGSLGGASLGPENKWESGNMTEITAASRRAGLGVSVYNHSAIKGVWSPLLLCLNREHFD